jgi:GNAT superfamily N-acetyltransferase
MGPMIRLAREDELPRIVEIEDSAAEVFEREGYPLGDGADTAPAENWRPALEAGLLWVCEDAQQIPVAFLAGHIHEDVFYVAELDVHLDHQHQGIGRRLMNTAEQQARAMGLSQMALTTFTHVPWNAPFYQKLGFEIVEHPPAWLASILRIEAEKGLTNRCGMILKLA